MRKVISFTCLVLLSSCSSYTYFARIERPDALGTKREVLAYWRVTKRVFWYDESSEGVVVKTACSPSVMDFEERPGGIVMRSDDTWVGAREEGGQAICGRVVGVDHVTEIEVGQSIRVELWCTPAQDDEFASPYPYLPAGSYDFSDVGRQKKNVDVAACSSPPPSPPKDATSPADAPAAPGA
ncbi:MAG: hypothetical protein RLZZ450_2147 [Pseudomonadota bacterium]|jgi:hypothetical protein